MSTSLRGANNRSTHAGTIRITTVNYQARIHEYDITFTPYYGSKDLSFDDAAKTLQLTYSKTILHYDRGHVNTTGLDPIAIRAQSSNFTSANPDADPQLPIASTADPRLSVDAEGLVLNSDGTCVKRSLPPCADAD